MSIEITTSPYIIEYNNSIISAVSHTHLKAEITDWDAPTTYVQETQPISGEAGDLWFGTTSHELKVHDGSTFQPQNTNDGYF